ncbi:hypothetical protein [Pseudomonas sp. H3(2019)]|uniref:hypothetical protein n=1 Tax=Pseudomonas sp. H3(2019) TaxID=2598724 RepID=UPI001197F627|nr:hypothetical protein [Pseudomonas sp. H3(2019)]TVT86333.1 hypothetical protein FPT12_00120 [Pseudomonas sp. H3(2019)]
MFVNGEREGYLAVVSDSNLFGSFACMALILALTGLRTASRNSKLHRTLTFVTLMGFAVIHGIGTYFLNQPPA